MLRRTATIILATVLSLSALLANVSSAAEAPRKPNIIFILADDLGYGDLGCYGQKQIKTPNIDRLANEGLRFTDAYAGCTVCAPSRCALLTGYNMGHASVRGNAKTTLKPEDVTVGEVLKSAGYATGIIGKWGMGDPGSTGVPNRQGFDYFFGYLNHKHAHNYYPAHLYLNDQEFPLAGNVESEGVSTERAQYSHDLFAARALEFVEQHRREPFCLYLAFTTPHANNEAKNKGMEVPSDEPYSREPWPEPQRNHAAMITRMDADIGRLMAKLKELGLDESTVVFFSSDNGPHKEGGGDPAFFHASGPLRGYKRDLTEGGIRVPFLARWPGKIDAGRTTSQPIAFWDVLPTLTELAGTTPPSGIDGVSIVPTLLGPERAGRPQTQHEFFYWEFHERGFQQAVRMGSWKAIRPQWKAPLELYNLSNDVGETHNVAADHPEVIAKIETYLSTARTDSPDWPIRPAPVKKTP
jgi:arylsulfatase A-like enzyme